MNVERLVDLVEFVLSVEGRLTVQARYDQLNNALSQLVSAPNQQNYQTQVASSMEALLGALQLFDEAFLPPQVENLKDIQDSHFLGGAMAPAIREAISKNGMTPAAARQTVAEITNRRANVLGVLRQTQTSLKQLGFTQAVLPANSAELGFLLPRKLFENKFDDLIRELKFVAETIGYFSEAVIGRRADINVGDISTSDPIFFLGTDMTVLVEISISVKFLLDALKSVLDIRNLLQQSKAADLSEAGLKHFEDLIAKSINEKIEQRVQELIKNYRGEATRMNELANALRHTLKQLAVRIEKGMTIEVRQGQIAAKAEGAQPAKAEELKLLAKELHFPKFSDAPMLEIALSHADEDGGRKDDPAKGAPTKKT